MWILVKIHASACIKQVCVVIAFLHLIDDLKDNDTRVLSFPRIGSNTLSIYTKHCRPLLPESGRSLVNDVSYIFGFEIF